MASKVQLNLTVKQAQALVDILANVGGHPERSPRGEADRVYNRLRALGFQFQHPYVTRGSIYFKEDHHG